MKKVNRYKSVCEKKKQIKMKESERIWKQVKKYKKKLIQVKA